MKLIILLLTVVPLSYRVSASTVGNDVTYAELGSTETPKKVTTTVADATTTVGDTLVHATASVVPTQLQPLLLPSYEGSAVIQYYLQHRCLPPWGNETEEEMDILIQQACFGTFRFPQHSLSTPRYFDIICLDDGRNRQAPQLLSSNARRLCCLGNDTTITPDEYESERERLFYRVFAKPPPPRTTTTITTTTTTTTTTPAPTLYDLYQEEERSYLYKNRLNSPCDYFENIYLDDQQYVYKIEKGSVLITSEGFNLFGAKESYANANSTKEKLIQIEGTGHVGLKVMVARLRQGDTLNIQYGNSTNDSSEQLEEGSVRKMEIAAGGIDTIKLTLTSHQQEGQDSGKYFVAVFLDSSDDVDIEPGLDPKLPCAETDIARTIGMDGTHKGEAVHSNELEIGSASTLIVGKSGAVSTIDILLDEDDTNHDSVGREYRCWYNLQPGSYALFRGQGDHADYIRRMEGSGSNRFVMESNWYYTYWYEEMFVDHNYDFRNSDAYEYEVDELNDSIELHSFSNHDIFHCLLRGVQHLIYL